MKVSWDDYPQYKYIYIWGKNMFQTTNQSTLDDQPENLKYNLGCQIKINSFPNDEALFSATHRD